MTYATAHRPATWLDQFFSDFDRGAFARTAPSFVPAVDVVEEADAYVLRAELAGVAREGIRVEVKENRLVLSGKKEAASRAEDGKYRYVESRHGEFSRTFELPRNVKSDAVEASFKDGALTLRIPKADEAKPKTIEIR
ncbi:MAG TPA: Hsp20/alpha crystallin family protein [Fibrobacteria bacterium]|nr:Hsp20/alpha crystallin family protein [Fibrobacteria bacterium]